MAEEARNVRIGRISPRAQAKCRIVTDITDNIKFKNIYYFYLNII